MSAQGVDRATNTDSDPIASARVESSGSSGAVGISDNVRAAIARGVLAAPATETCGLLLGDLPRARITAQRKLRCVEASHAHFVVDPLDLIEAELEARREGLDVVGLWHAHPSGELEPSEADLEAARRLWGRRRTWVYAIVTCAPELGTIASRTSSSLRLRAYRLDDGSLLELRVGSSATDFGTRMSSCTQESR